MVSVCKGDSKTLVEERYRCGLSSWYRMTKEFDPRELVDQTVADEQVSRPQACKKLEEDKSKLRELPQRRDGL